jgi:hypothetical protein
MRILVTDPNSLGNLVAYLTRCGCSAGTVGSNAVEASPVAPRAVASAHLRMQLDAYVRVWMAMHPGVTAVIVGQAESESPAWKEAEVVRDGAGNAEYNRTAAKQSSDERDAPDASLPSCLACGALIEKGLTFLGSLRCVECRDKDAPLQPLLVGVWTAAGAPL